MPYSLQPLLLALASLLLVSQCGASVQSLINAVNDMEKSTNKIIDPNAWKSQKEVLSRFGNTHPSADIKAVREVINKKIANLTKAIADENERRLHPTDWCPRPWKRVHSNLCVSTSHEAATWDDANGLCRFFNATLATFRNLEDYKAVAKEGVVLYQCPWVGIKWEGGKLNFYGPKEYKFVYNLKKENGDCVTACVEKMAYNPCAEKKNFICLKKRA